MFRELLCSSSGGQYCIIQHLVFVIPVGGHPVHKLREDLCTRRPPTGVMIPDTVLIQFLPPDDEHIVLETRRGI